MDRTNVGERAFAAPPAAETEAIEFVRFCHRRRRVGWPELYDEMCAVAGRGLYHGYGSEELASIGIGFGLFQMPALAVIVAQVVAEDVERRRRSAEALRATLAAEALRATLAAEVPALVAVAGPGLATEDAVPRVRSVGSEPIDVGASDARALRIAVAAGA
ncbi:MAG: hypothetical protein H0V73_11335 [Chloroflexi bacterium]|nr:hypothetical protein [Chloroflexota bacterium]